MDKRNAIEVEEVTDPAELARARKLDEQADANSAWLQGHIADVYTKHRGKFICVAGQELFVGETVKEAVAQATAAHPDDEGCLMRYILMEKVPRIYAV